MKNFLTILLLVWSQLVFGQAEPITSLQGQATSKFTSPKLVVPNSQATKTSLGGLIETGNMNVLPDPGAEGTTTAWTVYANTSANATPSPAARAGTVSHIAVAYSATSPLYGNKSLIMTNTGTTSALGEGAYIPFTINSGGKGKVFSISFDYTVFSGTYTDDQVAFWIWDVTNATLIQPSAYLLKNTTINDRMVMEFQTSSSSTSYQLIAHVAGVGTTAWGLKFDNFDVSSGRKTYVSPISQPVQFDPNTNSQGFGTLSSQTCFYTRAGNKAHISCTYTASSCSAVEARMGLPFTVDSSYNPALANVGTYAQSTSDTGGSQISLAEAGKNYLTFGYNGAGSLTKRNASNLGSCGTFSVNATVPVLGWSSTVQSSDQGDSRIVDFNGVGTGSTQSLTASVTNVDMTKLKDSHNAWSSGVYTVPVPGDYNVSAYLYSGATSTLFGVFINGNANKYLTWSVSGTGGGGAVIVPDLKAGDTISVRALTTCSLAGDSRQHISISKIQGPAQITASETIAAKYVGTTGTTIGTSAAAVVFNTKVFDTHSAYNSTTGIYTAPISGKYQVCERFLATVNATVNSGILSMLYQNSALVERLDYKVEETGSGTAIDKFMQGCGDVQALAGDTIEVRTSRDSGQAAVAINTSTSLNSITIRRVGNY